MGRPDRGPHRHPGRPRSRRGPARRDGPGPVRDPSVASPAARSCPMHACMPRPKLKPHRGCPSATVRWGSNASAASPKIDGSRFAAIRSIVTWSPACRRTPLGSSTSASAHRIAIGLEGCNRMVSCTQRCRNARSVRASAAAAGFVTSNPKMLCNVRTNAVAEVCAPASRKKHVSRNTTSGGSSRLSRFLSRTVSTSRGRSSSSSSPASNCASAPRRRAIDGTRNSRSNDARAAATSARLASRSPV